MEPIQITCNVISKPVQFEIDIGSFLLTIYVENLNEMSNIQINPTTKRAIGYSNSPIKFKGKTNLNVECNNVKVSHTFLIVDSNSVSLLGRDMCSKLNIEIVLSSDKHCTHAINQDVFTNKQTNNNDLVEKIWWYKQLQGLIVWHSRSRQCTLIAAVKSHHYNKLD